MAKDCFNKLESDIVDFFEERLKNFSIPIDMGFEFQSNSKQKNQLVKLTKIPDQYSVLLNKDILVQVNEEYFDVFDEDAKKILFDQEIDKIQFNLEKGTFKIGKSNIITSQGIVEKYTYEQVQRALEIERLYEEQKKDQ